LAGNDLIDRPSRQKKFHDLVDFSRLQFISGKPPEPFLFMVIFGAEEKGFPVL
jgi:hypothetical protein